MKNILYVIQDLIRVYMHTYIQENINSGHVF